MGNPESDIRVRELLEIEKMRNLEISRFDDEVDEIHKTKDRRINQLTEDLWHSNRRADDLDRRWNELAQSYEQTKSDLDRTGGELVRIQQQKSYRAMLKIIALLKGRPITASLERLRSKKKERS